MHKPDNSSWLWKKSKSWKKFFGKNVELPKWLDYPLRSLKYLLLAFFGWVILFGMSTPQAQEFLDGDYWKVADVKMLKFFTDISPTALIVTTVLALLSIPIRNFWCRYLCPYGGLLGLIGLASPFAIARDDDVCHHCRKCTRNCPAHLPVEASLRVLSPECTSCLTCVSGCPSGALSYSVPRRFLFSFRVSGFFFPAVILIIFFGVILVAKGLGYWHSGVSEQDLQRLIPQMSELGHPK